MKQQTNEPKIYCPHCHFYDLPNTVRSMGGRRVEYYCFRCGNFIGVKYSSRKKSKEEAKR